VLAEGWGGVDTGTGLHELTSAPAAAAMPMQAMRSMAKFAVGGSAGGFQNSARDAATDRAASAPPPPPAAGRGQGMFKSLRKAFSGDKAKGEKAASMPAPMPATPARREREVSAMPASDGLVQLLAHQAADGSFDASAPVDAVLRDAGQDGKAAWEAVDRLVADAQVPPAIREKARQTLVVLLALRLAFADRHSTWSRGAKKAIRWLADAAGLPAARVQAWLDERAAGAGRAG
jgi:hypothetical protein